MSRRDAFSSFRRHGNRHGNRHGAAVIELAVCLPILVLLIFASLDGANLLFVRQAAVQAAYETAKAVTKPDGNVANALALGEQVLQSRRITQHRISFSPANVQAAAKGVPIVVTVEVDGTSRNLTGIGPFRNKVIRAEVVMTRE